jgi:hypothetical protein
MEAEATLPAAQAAWMTEQNTRVKAAQDEVAAAKAAAAKPGVQALGTEAPKAGAEAPAQAGDPIADFNALVDAQVAKGLTRQKAIAAVIRANPEAHEAFLAANTVERKRRR